MEPCCWNCLRVMRGGSRGVLAGVEGCRVGGGRHTRGDPATPAESQPGRAETHQAARPTVRAPHPVPQMKGMKRLGCVRSCLLAACCAERACVCATGCVVGACSRDRGGSLHACIHARACTQQSLRRKPSGRVLLRGRVPSMPPTSSSFGGRGLQSPVLLCTSRKAVCCWGRSRLRRARLHSSTAELDALTKVLLLPALLPLVLVLVLVPPTPSHTRRGTAMKRMCECCECVCVRTCALTTLLSHACVAGAARVCAAPLLCAAHLLLCPPLPPSSPPLLYLLSSLHAPTRQGVGWVLALMDACFFKAPALPDKRSPEQLRPAWQGRWVIPPCLTTNPYLLDGRVWDPCGGSGWRLT